MKRFPETAYQIQLSNDIAELMEALVNSVSNPEEAPWEETSSLMEATLARHMFTGVFNPTNPLAHVLWNTCFVLIKKLEASPYDPNLWIQVWKPFSDLSRRIEVDATREFMMTGEHDSTAPTQATE
jgi:hypothetical protein